MKKKKTYKKKQDDVRAIIPRRELQKLENKSHLNWKVNITMPLWPAPGRPIPVLRTAYDIAEETLNNGNYDDKPTTTKRKTTER